MNKARFPLPEFTARVHGPSTRAVNSGSGIGFTTDDGDVVGGRRYDVRDDKQQNEESQQHRHTERDLVAGLRRQPVDLHSH